MAPTFKPPQNYRQRPVVVLGGGVLGRRIACVWVSAGYDVRVFDPSAKQLTEAITYVNENVATYAQNTRYKPGKAEGIDDMKGAVKDAWLVVEAVPEKIQLKIDIFAELSAITSTDTILVSNSSSYRTSDMLEKVPDAVKPRILNMHYYPPPECMIVELMTDGFTYPDLIVFMSDRSKEASLYPYIARKESTGFIFNRLWAAIKRECLTILAEGVSVPEEIDSMWTRMFLQSSFTPCTMMDSKSPVPLYCPLIFFPSSANVLFLKLE